MSGVYIKPTSKYITLPTHRQKVFQAQLYLHLSYDYVHERLTLNVDKNRNGPSYIEIDSENLQEGIKIISDIFARLKFQDRNKLFQTNIRQDLEKAMSDVLLKGQGE